MPKSDQEIQSRFFELYRIALEQKQQGDKSASDRVRYYAQMINRHKARMHRKSVLAEINA